MALRALMLNKKLLEKRTSLEEAQKELEEKREDEVALGEAIEEATTEEETTAVEDSITEHEKAIGEIKDKITGLEEEIKAIEEEIAEIKEEPENEPQKIEGERVIKDKFELVRSGLQNYVQKRELRDDPAPAEEPELIGFKVVNGGALVPEEMLAPYQAPEEEIRLEKLVNTVGVKRGSGSYPIITKSNGKMVSVAELEKNPELAKPVITDADYKIETYRGYIPVSQEVIDDADYNIADLIAKEIARQELNTKNSAIAGVLKTATAKFPKGLDKLKEIFNVDLKKVYTAKAIISASLYNVLDTMKDENGRYLLQDNIAAASGKMLFGKEVVVLDDDVIGITAGDLKGFIGDPKAFCTVFNRKEATIKWIDNTIYGTLLAGFVRFDVVKVDTAAGFYITFEEEEVVTP